MEKSFRCDNVEHRFSEKLTFGLGCNLDEDFTFFLNLGCHSPGTFWLFLSSLTMEYKLNLESAS